ncbi:hypothetical protein HFP15_37165 [Amycolatopsis sp. K13G38]|uniref:DUF6802 domain-containing protein n=1 Tax=Amycolatopsis acididurans TaxID=2724524 RepID=A0ABX1JJ69_9PSEU|nr:DUF6802 family protein [Amycolatopsis acididurans]NKQ58495.1 hypothetical protein [Amycolatopsis acididurans]
MWIDDTGGAESPEGGHDGEMEISVEGQTYSAEENLDIDHDGHNDAVRLDNADGTITAYVDSDHDGHADQYLHTDAEGNVVESARFDSSTGEWVADGGSDTTHHGGDEQTGRQGDITADMQGGTVDLGHATIDSNSDGTADTAVVTDQDGNTRMFTDVDGDGKADVQTIITPDGESHTYEHTGPGQWTETNANGVAADVPADSDQLWGGGRDTVVEGVAKIDSITGQWISQN